METPIETVELPDLVLIGLEVEGDRQALHRLLPDAWQRLFAVETGATAFLAASQALQNGLYHEVVGFLAASKTEAPEGMVKWLRPAASYLRLSHDGRLEDIPAGFTRLEQYAVAHGLKLTGLQLDFGYLPGLAPSRHELHAELEPAPLLLG